MKRNMFSLVVLFILSVAEGVVLIPSPIHAVSCALTDDATNTLNSACVIDGTTFVESGVTSFNGVTNGDLRVSGADVTVAPGVTMTWSPGKAIIIENGGRIIRGANAVLKQVDPQAWFRQQLGFDTFAAGAAVKVLGNNLHVCNGDPCTVVAPSAAGNLVVESSIKFADGTTQTTAASGMTSGMIVAFASACPTGWTEYTAARGRTVVGTPGSGTNAATTGTALTNSEDRTHTHTGPSHTHTGPSHTHPQNYASSGAGWDCGATRIRSTDLTGAVIFITACNDGTSYALGSGVSAGGTAATGASGTAATGTAATSGVMPYIQLTYCSKN